MPVSAHRLSIKKKRFLFTCIIAFSLVACESTSGVVSSFRPALDERLLSVLVRVAESGTEVICDAARLESALQIKIGPPTVRKHSNGVGQIERQESRILAGPFGSSAPYDGVFEKFRSPIRSSCALVLRSPELFVCDVESSRVRRIMQTDPARGPSNPHGTQYGIRYVYTSADGSNATINLGNSEMKCTSQVSLEVVGNWK